MSKISAKRLLRTLNPRPLTEASAQAIERKLINDALKALTKAVAAGVRVRRESITKLVAAHKTCEGMLDKIARTVDDLLDSTRGPADSFDARIEGLENFASTIEDLQDNIETAASFLGTEKLRRGSVGGPNRGPRNATLAMLRSEFAVVKRDVKMVEKNLNDVIKDMTKAAERLDYVADANDDEVAAEFMDEVGDAIQEAEADYDELETAADRLGQ